MNECFGRNFILNGDLKHASDFDQSLVYEGDSVYEVIRMLNGKPVFFRDHMERLTSSVHLQGKDMLADITQIRTSIMTLAGSDRQKEINLKIIFNYNNGPGNYLIYFVEPAYPTTQQYREGVKGILFPAERKDPESKVINHRLRSSIYHKLILEGAYEALLVNEMDMITEGSRSNIFFVRDGELFTAPDNMVLGGITRKHILRICNDKKINIRFTCISASEITSCQSVFMTGTSPMVLPFNSIGDISFDTALPVIGELRELYSKRAVESITEFMKE